MTPARALEIWSDAPIAQTFDAPGTVGWRSDTAENRRAAQDVMRKVRRAIAHYESQPSACGKGEHCAMTGWYALLDSLRNASAAEKLDAVNHWVNRLPYVTDRENWGVADYWESPAEMIARGGQCEDYALVKYIALRALGFPSSAMRIVAVRDGFEDHAVLVVRLDGRIYLMDNLERTVVESSAAPAYRLIYAVNENSFWHYVNTDISVPDSPGLQPASDPYQPIETAATSALPVARSVTTIPEVRPLTTAEIAEAPVAALNPTAPAAASAPALASLPAPATEIALAAPPVRVDAASPLATTAAATPAPAPTMEQTAALPPTSPNQETPASPY